MVTSYAGAFTRAENHFQPATFTAIDYFVACFDDYCAWRAMKWLGFDVWQWQPFVVRSFSESGIYSNAANRCHFLQQTNTQTLTLKISTNYNGIKCVCTIIIIIIK